MENYKPEGNLRKGWTTGACATAAAKAAFVGLITGETPSVIEITLPRGQKPLFSIAKSEFSSLRGKTAFASVVKDAGDDPDVTHGALISARVCLLPVGAGVVFKAGDGVGIVTKAGLPLAVGEPAINPVPRQMMELAIAEVAKKYGVAGDVEIEISVQGGKQLALKTLNPRLGILGGISILGTTGIVIPFSCSAWIHSIYRGVDVARAAGLTHIAGATGRTSEEAVQNLYSLSEEALIDMGDFVGGMLKYLRKNPVAKVTIAGGIGKICKLAQGMADLHSRAGAVDLDFLAEIAGIPEIKTANTAKHAFEIAGEYAPKLAQDIANIALKSAKKMLNKPEIALEIIIFDREGKMLAKSDKI